LISWNEKFRDNLVMSLEMSAPESLRTWFLHILHVAATFFDIGASARKHLFLVP
jgi:hypothetical protein